MSEWKENLIKGLIARGEKKIHPKSVIRYYVYMLESNLFLGRSDGEFFLAENPPNTFSFRECVAILFLSKSNQHYLQNFDWLLIEA